MKVLPEMMTDERTKVDREQKVQREQEEYLLAEHDFSEVDDNLHHAVEQVGEHHQANTQVEHSGVPQVEFAVFLGHTHRIVDEIVGFPRIRHEPNDDHHESKHFLPSRFEVFESALSVPNDLITSPQKSPSKCSK